MDDVICRGSFALGTACGQCSKCRQEIEHHNAMKGWLNKLNTPSSALIAMREQAEQIEALTAERDRLHQLWHQARHDRDCFLAGVSAQRIRAEAAEAKLAQAVEVLDPLIAFALDNMYEVDIQAREAVEKDIMAARIFLSTIQPEGEME